LHARLLALDGRVLGAWEIAGAREMEIGLPDLQGGLYLLELTTQAHAPAFHRLLIH
jgi:hypothetical protein